LSRNRISNISFTVCSVGEIIILAIMVGILKAVKSEETTENNTRAFSILLAFSGGIWRESLHQLAHAWFKGLVLCALPWFIFEKRRPGLDLPVETNLFTVGIKQIYAAVKECWKLKQTFLYLLFYFLMSVSYSRHPIFPLMMIQGVMFSTQQCMVLVMISLLTYGLHRTVIATLQNRYDSSKFAG